MLRIFLNEFNSLNLNDDEYESYVDSEDFLIFFPQLRFPNSIDEKSKIVLYSESQLERIREGWKIRGITHKDNGETIFEHQVRLAQDFRFYCASLSDLKKYELNDIEYYRGCLLTKFHDISEGLVPDFTPGDNIPKMLKHFIELRAIKVLNTVIPKTLAHIIENALLEFDEKQTQVSLLITELDKYCVVPEALNH